MRFILGRCWQSVHDLCAERIVRRSDGVMFRALVRRNSYDDQSTFTVHSWTSVGWSLVTQMPLKEASIRGYRPGIGVGPNWEEFAEEDLSRLIRQGFISVPRQKKESCNACQGARKLRPGATSASDTDPCEHTCGKGVRS